MKKMKWRGSIWWKFWHVTNEQPEEKTIEGKSSINEAEEMTAADEY